MGLSHTRFFAPGRLVSLDKEDAAAKGKRMRETIIEPQVEGKGRSFKALCLASVEADLLWSGGQTETLELRPVWAMFAGSEQELRPFMANLRTGRRLDMGSSSYRRKADRMTFLRSAGYTVTWQREPEGSVATVYLSDLFEMDPGMIDPEGAAFLLLPTVAWASAQKIDIAPLIQHVKPLIKGYNLSDEYLAEMVPSAFLFAAYLDRRTRCPILADGRFYLQLMLACLAQGLASLPSDDLYNLYRSEFGVHKRFGIKTTDTESVGLSRGIAFKASHAEIELLLAEQVTLFFKRDENI